jgi:hypothetical protein
MRARNTPPAQLPHPAPSHLGRLCLQPHRRTLRPTAGRAAAGAQAAMALAAAVSALPPVCLLVTTARIVTADVSLARALRPRQQAPPLPPQQLCHLRHVPNEPRLAARLP